MSANVILGSLLVAGGAAFLFLGALGIVRMPRAKRVVLDRS